jgi:hypothetical protein
MCKAGRGLKPRDHMNKRHLHIRRLQIAMDDTLLMRSFQGFRKMLRHLQLCNRRGPRRCEMDDGSGAKQQVRSPEVKLRTNRSLPL